MKSEDPELAAFQACFLEALDANAAAADIRCALLLDSATHSFMDYIAGFDDDMLEVAALLVKKWGLRSRTGMDGGDSQSAPQTGPETPRSRNLG